MTLRMRSAWWLGPARGKKPNRSEQSTSRSEPQDFGRISRAPAHAEAVLAEFSHWATTRRPMTPLAKRTHPGVMPGMSNAPQAASQAWSTSNSGYGMCYSGIAEETPRDRRMRSKQRIDDRTPLVTARDRRPNTPAQSTTRSAAPKRPSSAPLRRSQGCQDGPAWRRKPTRGRSKTKAEQGAPPQTYYNNSGDAALAYANQYLFKKFD